MICTWIAVVEYNRGGRGRQYTHVKEDLYSKRSRLIPIPIRNCAESVPTLSHQAKMSPQSLSHLIDSNRPGLGRYEELYKHLHSHPELSLQEKETAATAASNLRQLDVFDIHEHIGGHGLAGVFKNGSGKTVLLRADMDGLPVEEKTGLPYASKVTMKDDADGITKPVMRNLTLIVSTCKGGPKLIRL